MGTLNIRDLALDYQWASDVSFEGLRLEVLSGDGDVFFEVSIPDAGQITINTGSNEVAADLIEAAIEIARRRRSAKNSDI